MLWNNALAGQQAISGSSLPRPLYSKLTVVSHDEYGIDEYDLATHHVWDPISDPSQYLTPPQPVSKLFWTEFRAAFLKAATFEFSRPKDLKAFLLHNHPIVPEIRKLRLFVSLCRKHERSAETDKPLRQSYATMDTAPQWAHRLTHALVRAFSGVRGLDLRFWRVISHTFPEAHGTDAMRK